jgi:hypothetical protein
VGNARETELENPYRGGGHVLFTTAQIAGLDFHCRGGVLRAGLGAEGVLDSGLPAAIAPTIYARLGDIPAAVAVAIALIIAIRRRAAKAVL